MKDRVFGDGTQVKNKHCFSTPWSQERALCHSLDKLLAGYSSGPFLVLCLYPDMYIPLRHPVPSHARHCYTECSPHHGSTE